VVRIPMATSMATFSQRSDGALGRKTPLTSCCRCGSKQTRTADPFLVREVLYQLSYAPGSLSALVGGPSSPFSGCPSCPYACCECTVCAIRAAAPFTASDATVPMRWPYTSAVVEIDA
jgi:hypothetical protein